MHVSHSPTGGLFPPLPFRVPNTLRKETVDIRQRAVAGDEETETFHNRCRETEFLGQRQTARKGAGAQGVAIGRQNLLAEPRHFGANRRVRGNLR